MGGWASSQDEGWVPRASIPKEQGGNSIALSADPSDVTASLPGQIQAPPT